MRGNSKTQANRLPHGMPHTAGGLSVFYRSLSPQTAERLCLQQAPQHLQCLAAGSGLLQRKRTALKSKLEPFTGQVAVQAAKNAVPIRHLCAVCHSASTHWGCNSILGIAAPIAVLDRTERNVRHTAQMCVAARQGACHRAALNGVVVCTGYAAYLIAEIGIVADIYFSR